MKKILIADGERDYRTLCQEALEAEGYAVSLAATGEEALAKVRDEAPDLVVLDLNLPGDGLETLGKMVETRWHGPPVIVTSRWYPCYEGFLLWRAEEWVAKSKDLGSLKAAVHRLLGARLASTCARDRLRLLIPSAHTARE